MAQAVRATGYGGRQMLSVLEESVAEPTSSEVRIQVRTSAVNPLDLLEYSGAFGEDPHALPLRLGHELAGVVTDVGAEAIGPAGPIAVGDEVIAYYRDRAGAYASELVWPAATVLPKPAGLDWQQAAGLLLAGTTAVHALAATGVDSGDTLLIHGVSGSVGLLAAQLAQLRGARVVGTTSTARHETLRGYGVEPISAGPGLSERIRECCGSRHLDAAIDAVGTSEAIETSLELVTDRPRIATLVAFDHGNQEGIHTLGAGGSAKDPGTEIRANARSQLVSLADDGHLDIPLAKTFPLTEAAAAHELVATGHTGGKVILQP